MISSNLNIYNFLELKMYQLTKKLRSIDLILGITIRNLARKKKRYNF